MERILVRRVQVLKLKKLNNSKFKANQRRCWTKSTKGCENQLSISDLIPAEDVRLLVKDFKGGGTKYKDHENNQILREEETKELALPGSDLIKEVKSKSSNLRERFESFKAAGLVSQAGTLKSLAKKYKKVSGDSQDKGSAAVEEEYSEVSNLKQSDVGAVTSQEEVEEEEEEEYKECVGGSSLSVKVEKSEECWVSKILN